MQNPCLNPTADQTYEVIGEGERVTVEAVEGVKLIVRARAAVEESA